MTDELNDAVASVKRMQNFDVTTLPRERDLGTNFEFSVVVPPARKLVGLYKQLNTDSFADFSENVLNRIQQRANGDFAMFDQVLEFDPTAENAKAQRDSHIKAIQNAYQAAFDVLHPFIAYSITRAADIEHLQDNARAAMQTIRDQSSEIRTDLEKHQTEAAEILADIRKTAAEQGVSQQAIYFKQETEFHDKAGFNWLVASCVMAGTVVCYAVATLFIHRLPGVETETQFHAIQVVASKLLIFGVLSYMLFACVRNFQSHRHNSVLNRHRQNSLMTFKVLSDAAATDDGREIVLTQAANSIFSQQDSGYVKNQGNHSGLPVDLLPKASIRLDQAGPAS